MGKVPFVKAADVKGEFRDPPRTSKLLLAPKFGGVKNVSMGMNITEVGSMIPDHAHTDSEEVLFLISGRARIVIEGGEQQVLAHDSTTGAIARKITALEDLGRLAIRERRLAPAQEHELIAADGHHRREPRPQVVRELRRILAQAHPVRKEVDEARHRQTSALRLRLAASEGVASV